jgi:antitoxin ParD1/3/4
VQEMATIRKTITFTEQQDQWIKSQILAGNFTNDSEYIRDLIRRDQEKNGEIHQIRMALIAGEKSGLSKRSPEQIRKNVQDKLRKNGKL